jgi:ribosomal protein S11
MDKRLFITAISFFFALQGFAQQLPLGTCGIVNVYDAAGNRTKRVYFCNNGIDPYPTGSQPAGKGTETVIEKNETKEFQYVDALFPNPTTGRFFVTFSKSLSNASISITDNNGKTIVQFKASGYKVDFDLSPYAAGMYYVRIEEDGKAITKKVVKQ